MNFTRLNERNFGNDAAGAWAERAGKSRPEYVAL